MLLRSDHGRPRAEIHVAADLTTCWRRFVIAKEFCHLLIDTPDDHTGNIVTLVEHLIMPVPPLGTRNDVDSEITTHFAAIELLMPWDHRGLLWAARRVGHSNYRIATDLRVPEKVAEYWFTDECQTTLVLAHGGGHAG